MTVTVRSTWLFPSLRKNGRFGKSASTRPVSRSKAARTGRAAATAFIFAIRMVTCSNLQRRACGRDIRAHIGLSSRPPVLGCGAQPEDEADETARVYHAHGRRACSIDGGAGAAVDDATTDRDFPSGDPDHPPDRNRRGKCVARVFRRAAPLGLR